MPEGFDFKGIQNEKGLKNFAKALPSVLVQSGTRNVVKAASEGSLSKYTQAINSLKLKGIRDYNFVLVIFSPIVAAAQAVLKYVEKHGDNLDEQHTSLAKQVDDVLGHIDFKNLCDSVGAGEGSEIEKILNRFSYYKKLLQGISSGKYGKNNDLFMKRAARITPWRVNRKSINKLTLYMNTSFGTRIGNALKKSLPIGPAPRPPQSPQAKSPSAVRPAMPKVQMHLNSLPKKPFNVRSDADFNKLQFGLPQGVTRVVIESGITQIPPFAFARCSTLESVTIPDTVQKIGKGAFRKCSNLKNIIIPEGVVTIGDYCFKECINLEKVDMPTSVQDIGLFAFNFCRALKEIVIPEGVKEIKWSTFDNCKNLTKVTIPNSVGEIGDEAFGGCPKNMQILGSPRPEIKKTIQQQIGYV